MPDITEVIGVDEKYTIVAEQQQQVAGGSDDILKGAAIGTVAGRGLSVTVKVPQKTYVKVAVPKTIVVNRYIRDTSRLMKAVEELNNPQSIVTAMEVEKMRERASGVIAKRKDMRDRRREMQNMEGEPFISKKTILGVQTAKVFKDAEQISVDRMITRQKKELRQELKESAYKIKDLTSANERFRNTISNYKSEIKSLRSQLQNANIRAKKAEYRLGKMHDKLTGNILAAQQAFVPKPSKKAIPFAGGQMMKAAMQAVEPARLLGEVQLTSGQTETVSGALFDKPGADQRNQNLQQKMARKNRR